MDELRTALELANDDELQDLTEILFRPKFNPLDYVRGTDPVRVISGDRRAWLDAVERRFRFLAADGFTVLRGESQRISYRQVLVRVCRYLKLKYSPALSTEDLEADIFLNLIQRNWRNIPRPDQDELLGRVVASLSKDPTQPLPLRCNPDSLRILLQGGSVIALSSVARTLVLRQVSRQMAVYWSSVHLAGKAALVLPKQMALQLGRRGIAAGTARYGLARSAFTVLGGMLWAGLILDLGWRSISTNYGRIIPIIFTLAQIRLTRSPAWASA
ncbi:YaaW family protein [Lyngbya confervoides]|uniref:Uncharacterized protein n=1 Tax=Lyngbya confervoides BDU141951 TaxID=1574623 RepID=A0ABD4T4V6_9CYAN|nr:hypothetical protein [Lyngbya confervoides]MCM1983718.1 hypothetical protein [Lyngbya confervoides BDU141951]